MRMQSSATAAVSRAVAYIAAEQLPYGEIRTCRASEPTLSRDAVFTSSPYGTTYVLHSLRFVDDPQTAPVGQGGLAFIADEMEPPGLWRYYSSRNPKVLPPDLDDTACASMALRHVRDEIELGLNLRLILANRDADGRFRTFLTTGGNNVDAVVNANVLCYLGDREETAAASAYLCELITQGREAETSLYGVDDLSLYYVLSRAYFQGVKSLAPCCGRIVQRVSARQRADGAFGDELATALAVATLLNFAADAPEAVANGARFLLEAQRDDGSWPRSAFYIDFAGGFYGSDELTTAFAAEALARAGSELSAHN